MYDREEPTCSDAAKRLGTRIPVDSHQQCHLPYRYADFTFFCAHYQENVVYMCLQVAASFFLAPVKRLRERRNRVLSRHGQQANTSSLTAKFSVTAVYFLVACVATLGLLCMCMPKPGPTWRRERSKKAANKTENTKPGLDRLPLDGAGFLQVLHVSLRSLRIMGAEACPSRHPCCCRFYYMSSKELSLGLSSGRPGKVITNLPGRPAPNTSRKNGSL